MELIQFFIAVCLLVSLVILPVLVIWKAVLFFIGNDMTFYNAVMVLAELGFWICAGCLLIQTHNLRLSLGALWIEALIAVMVLYMGITFNLLFIYTQLYGSLPDSKKFAYIVIQGELYKKKDVLSEKIKTRLDKGIKLYYKNKNSVKIIISSIGNTDEAVNEGWEMEEYLLKNQVPQESICVLNCVTSVEESISRVMTYINIQGKKIPCLFITDDYDAFKLSLYTKKVGLRSAAICGSMLSVKCMTQFLQEYIKVMRKMEWALTMAIMIWLTVAGYSLFPL